MDTASPCEIKDINAQSFLASLFDDLEAKEKQEMAATAIPVLSSTLKLEKRPALNGMEERSLTTFSLSELMRSLGPDLPLMEVQDLPDPSLATFDLSGLFTSPEQRSSFVEGLGASSEQTLAAFDLSDISLSLFETPHLSANQMDLDADAHTDDSFSELMDVCPEPIALMDIDPTAEPMELDIEFLDRSNANPVEHSIESTLVDIEMSDWVIDELSFKFSSLDLCDSVDIYVDVVSTIEGCLNLDFWTRPVLPFKLAPFRGLPPISLASRTSETRYEHPLAPGSGPHFREADSYFNFPGAFP